MFFKQGIFRPAQSSHKTPPCAQFNQIAKPKHRIETHFRHTTPASMLKKQTAHGHYFVFARGVTIAPSAPRQPCKFSFRPCYSASTSRPFTENG